MTKLDSKLVDSRTGIISFRLRKPDGGWHRVTIQPGDDVDYIMACNNANLKEMGHTEIEIDSVSAIKGVIKEEHTDLVKEKFKAKAAKEQP